ncbi:hypothetical protein ACIQNG_05780 [Streptomyces sp. NPDC091377]|uniref:hypothetical protein n=1 Tax=Streptomyces sp. NPDC091377 TaxID=3365995 RepID=UPI0038264851
MVGPSALISPKAPLVVKPPGVSVVVRSPFTSTGVDTVVVVPSETTVSPRGELMVLTPFTVSEVNPSGVVVVVVVVTTGAGASAAVGGLCAPGSVLVEVVRPSGVLTVVPRAPVFGVDVVVAWIPWKLVFWLKPGPLTKKKLVNPNVPSGANPKLSFENTLLMLLLNLPSTVKEFLKLLASALPPKTERLPPIAAPMAPPIAAPLASNAFFSTRAVMQEARKPSANSVPASMVTLMATEPSGEIFSPVTPLPSGPMNLRNRVLPSRIAPMALPMVPVPLPSLDSSGATLASFASPAPSLPSPPSSTAPGMRETMPMSSSPTSIFPVPIIRMRLTASRAAPRRTPSTGTNTATMPITIPAMISISGLSAKNSPSWVSTSRAGMATAAASRRVLAAWSDAVSLVSRASSPFLTASASRCWAASTRARSSLSAVTCSGVASAASAGT